MGVERMAIRAATRATSPSRRVPDSFGRCSISSVAMMVSKAAAGWRARNSSASAQPSSSYTPVERQKATLPSWMSTPVMRAALDGSSEK